jgi:hypothetical protein
MGSPQRYNGELTAVFGEKTLKERFYGTNIRIFFEYPKKNDIIFI